MPTEAKIVGGMMADSAVIPPIKDLKWNGVPITKMSDALKMLSPSLSAAVKDTATALGSPPTPAVATYSVSSILSDPLNYLKNAGLNVLFVLAGSAVIFFYIKNQVTK